MEHIRNSVAGMTSRLLAGLEEPERVCAAWPLAAGHAIAKRTRAVSFAHRTLSVAVPDHAWQQQLMQLRPQMLLQLTRFTGVRIADILFFVETQSR